MKKANKANQQYLYLIVVLAILITAVAGWYFFSSVGSMLCVDCGGDGSTFNFGLSASPSSGIVAQGGTATTTITATLTSGTSNSVTLSVSACPTYATCSFNPISGYPTFTSTYKIITTTSTPVGSYPITISASGGGVTKTTTYTLTVYHPVTVPLLTASITSPTNGATFNSGNSITFTGSGSGGVTPYVYAWTSSRDGSIGISQTFSKNTLSVGDHIITLNVTDSTGRTATSQITIHVTAVTPLTASITSPTNGALFNSSNSITFTGSGSGGVLPYAYIWTSNIDGIIGNTQSFIKNDLSVGTHTITLNVIDSTNRTTQQRTIYVTSGSTPLIVSITSPTSGTIFNSGDPITFSGSASGGVVLSYSGSASGGIDPYTYSWTSDRDGIIGNTKTFTKNDLSAGGHIITLNVTDLAGTKASKQIIIAIIPLDFSLSIRPSSGKEIINRTTTGSTIKATLLSGSTRTVMLSVSNCPYNTFCNYYPKSGNPPFSSTLYIVSGPSAIPGTYTITINGVSGSVTKTATYTLTLSSS